MSKSFFDEILQSQDDLEVNLEFFKNFIDRPQNFFFYGEEYYEVEVMRDFTWLRAHFDSVSQYLTTGIDEPDSVGKGTKSLSRFWNSSDIQGRDALNYFGVISNLLSRCKIKAILLPGFENTALNRRLIDPAFLRDLVRLHPGDSALILQFTDLPEDQDTYLFNVFPRFETAYNKLDKWPGVLIWSKNSSVFLKVESERDVVEIFRALRQNDSISFLRNRFKTRRSDEEYGYFFHLSDLHLGKVPQSHSERLRNIIGKHLSQIDDKQFALPLITGDLINSPGPSNAQDFRFFCDDLLRRGFEESIYVLGNHDSRYAGWINFLRKQKAGIATLLSEKLTVLEDYRLAFIRFDSNVGGDLARGMIGDDQLAQVGNDLDRKLADPNCGVIALLHHHPRKIATPEWYAEKWFERWLGRLNLMDRADALIDANKLLDWLEQRNIDLLLHGHKHMPVLHSHNEIKIVGAGSSTGNIEHKEPGKTFITYNLIKYNLRSRQPVSSSIIAEEILGAGTRVIKTELYRTQ